MLRRVDISKINLDKAYFHFTNKNNIDRIALNNLLPKIGENSSMLKKQKRFSFQLVLVAF